MGEETGKGQNKPIGNKGWGKNNNTKVLKRGQRAVREKKKQQTKSEHIKHKHQTQNQNWGFV